MDSILNQAVINRLPQLNPEQVSELASALDTIGSIVDRELVKDLLELVASREVDNIFNGEWCMCNISFAGSRFWDELDLPIASQA